MKAILKGLIWLLGIGVLAVGSLFAINATDEESSEQTQALLALLRDPPPPTEKNGFIDFLALAAPANAPTYPIGLSQLEAYQKHSRGTPEGLLPDIGMDLKLLHRCRREFLACVKQKGMAATVDQLLTRYAAFWLRYQVMREKPEFVDLVPAPERPEETIPRYQYLIYGHRLAMLSAALHFNAGDRQGALKELESEFAFYRKAETGTSSLLLKMISFAMLDNSALFAAEMARRTSAADRAFFGRLEALVRSPTKDELDVTASVNVTQARVAQFMRTRANIRVSDGEYAVLSNVGVAPPKPWWEGVSPWLYRPNYSVNLFVAQSNIMLSVRELPSSEFLSGVEKLRSRARALAPGALWRLVLSPAAQNDRLLSDYALPAMYIGRMHGHAGLQTLVRLQVYLRSAGIQSAAEIARALEGPLRNDYRQPFKDKTMDFDPQAMEVGFPAEETYMSASGRDQMRVKGRVALEL